MSISSFKCDIFFSITGRGLVVAGRILEGNFEIGSWFWLKKTEKHPEVLKKIIAIEMIRMKDSEKIGLLLQTKDKFEIDEIKKYIIENEIAEIMESTYAPSI